MTSRLFSRPLISRRAMHSVVILLGVMAAFALPGSANAATAGAPEWMHAQVSAPLPAHDAETGAVLLYSETVLTVVGPGKMKRLDRRAYRILRREAEWLGIVHVGFNYQSRVTALRGWCIPATGKDYVTKDKDIAETGIPGVEGGELVSDVRSKLLRIPAAVAGSIIGYEIEQEQQPYDMSDEWEFQETMPVRESRYTVQVPAGWSYKAFWINHPEVTPTTSAAGAWSWTVSDVKAIELEEDMPPWRGIAGKMVLSLQPPDGGKSGFRSWQEVGSWYLDLTQGRRAVSPEIKQKVQELTATVPTPLGKMQALAKFVQTDIRYVAIELGIGGHQPHPAAEVFAQRYGDCKDKATLLAAMLGDIGIESYYVIINTRRGSITASTPPNLGFNHAILAIRLPENTQTAELSALVTDPKRGRLLFFDPTSPLIPFGRLSGALQANFGMVVMPEGGELMQLPQSKPESNGVRRTAKLSLDANGLLQGDVVESWFGDFAAWQRYELRSASLDVDQIKPVESMLSHSLPAFQLLKASIRNLKATDKPLEWNYTLEVDHFAKAAGDLLMVRPRVLGSKSSALLETREPRQYPIEFDAPRHDTDVFEITLPPDYVVDELPPPVDQDLGFVAYKSSTALDGHVLRYTRTFEVRELSVPATKADQLKNFYREIANDERMSAVLKRGP